MSWSYWYDETSLVAGPDVWPQWYVNTKPGVWKRLQRAIEDSCEACKGDRIPKVQYPWQIRETLEVVPYEVDVLEMTQKNLNTGTVRNLWRAKDENDFKKISPFYD